MSKQNPDILFIVPNFYISDNKEATLWHEALGPVILAKTAKNHGFNVEILRFWQVDKAMKDYNLFKENFLKKVLELSPKIVSFYTIVPLNLICIDLSRELKKLSPGIKLVLGGPQASLTAQICLQKFPEIDFVCRGEGETTIVPFLESVLGKNERSFEEVRGLSYRKSNEILHNASPEILPDNYKRGFQYYDLIPEKVIKESNFASIDVGRGCPFKCTFCSTSKFWNRKFRLRDLDEIIEEMLYVKEKFGIERFYFVHDLFTADKRRLKQFCNKLIALDKGLKWDCFARLDTVDIELVKLMVKSGCVAIRFGMESASTHIQEIIHKKFDTKRALQLIEDACKIQGLDVFVNFMFGFPGETEDDFDINMKTAIKLVLMGAKIRSGVLNF
ncbi:MAG: B12-binding domain-containing radical SAM protein [Enterococcus sp.]|nr:B12-binding domain-containing radical SAM protein [Enterococcus sp.]